MIVSKGGFKSSANVGESRSPTPNKSERSQIIISSSDFFKTRFMVKGKSPRDTGNLLATKKYNLSA